MASYIPIPGAVLVSANASGVIANQGTNSGTDSAAAVSADGRFVVFNSWGYNLVPGDTGSQYGNTAIDERDTFYKDVTTGAVSFVLLDEAGGRPSAQADLDLFYGAEFSISASGRYVAFETTTNKLMSRTFFGAAPGTTSTPNITSGDDNNYSDVYVRDMATGKTWLASSDAAGLSYSNARGAKNPTLSADGQRVAFVSSNDRLVSGDTNGRDDLFIKTLSNGAIIRVSTNSAGAQVQGAYDQPEFSADGRYLVFWSNASALVSGDTNNGYDVFRKDLQSGDVLRVSTSSTGNQAAPVTGFATFTLSVSDDGRYVAFASSSPDLVAGDTNARSDIFRKDLTTGNIERVSTTSAGVQIAEASESASMSGDGRYVVFTNTSDDILPRGDDSNGAGPDVFIKDMSTGQLKQVSNFSGRGHFSLHGTISADGSSIVVKTNAAAQGEILGYQYWRINNPFLTFDNSGNGGNGGTGSGQQITGTGRADVLTGSIGNDRFNGAGGDDLLNGGAGTDLAIYSGARAGYVISRSQTGYTVKDVSGVEGTDTLVSIERIQFSDITIAFDTAGSAGQAYRLYQAAFDRTPDRGGLGYQINAMDSGLGLAKVAANFIASPEFARTYGALDDTKFVTQLYQNVLHRAPDADGLAFHTGNLNTGANARADVLVGFSESPENQLALIGVIQNGMVYTL